MNSEEKVFKIWVLIVLALIGGVVALYFVNFSGGKRQLEKKEVLKKEALRVEDIVEKVMSQETGTEVFGIWAQGYLKVKEIPLFESMQQRAVFIVEKVGGEGSKEFLDRLFSFLSQKADLTFRKEGEEHQIILGCFGEGHIKPEKVLMIFSKKEG